MEILNFFINNNIIYILVNCIEEGFFIYKYNAKNFDLIEKINSKNNNLKFFMNGICHNKDNNKLYFIGGYDKDLAKPNFFDNYVVYDLETNNITLEKINIKNKCDFPIERLIVNNKNTIIKDNFLYLCGGILNDENIDDNGNLCVLDDFWKLDLKENKWYIISENIKNSKSNSIFDYLELSDCDENILIRGKYSTTVFYLYNIENNIFRKININNNEIMKKIGITIDISYYYDNNIYLIIKTHLGDIYNIEYSIKKNTYNMLFIMKENFNENGVCLFNDKLYFLNRNFLDKDKDKDKDKKQNLKNFLFCVRFKHKLYDLLINTFKNNQYLKREKYLPKHVYDDLFMEW
jgi:hypothetical protein